MNNQFATTLTKRAVGFEPTFQVTDDDSPSKSRQIEAIYFLFPFVVVLVIVFCCFLWRSIPLIQFYSRKPVLTKSEQVQIEYQDRQTKIGQLLDVEKGINEMDPNSIIVDSKLIKRESLLSLISKDSKEEIIVLKPLRKKESNRAIIVSGDPPEYH